MFSYLLVNVILNYLYSRNSNEMVKKLINKEWVLVKMERMYESLFIEDLEWFEYSYFIIILREYRDFLLEYNGGYLNLSVYKIFEKLGESIVNIFYGIGIMYDNLEKKFDFFDEIVEVGFMLIVDDLSGN